MNKGQFFMPMMMFIVFIGLVLSLMAHAFAQDTDGSTPTNEEVLAIPLTNTTSENLRTEALESEENIQSKEIKRSRDAHKVRRHVTH